MPDFIVDSLVLVADQALIDEALLDIEYGGVPPPPPPIATEGFSMVKIYRTKVQMAVYQKAVGADLSKFWLPYAPSERPMMKAILPRGTVVAVGTRLGETQLYIPDTWSIRVQPTITGNKRPPNTWRVTKLTE